MKLRAGRKFAGLVVAVFLAGVVLLVGDVLPQDVSGPYTTTAEVQVRNGPGDEYAVIATIPKDTKVNVAGKAGQWLRVESKRGRQPGYIHEQFARPLSNPAAKVSGPASAVAGAYTTTANVNLREGPGIQHKVLRTIPSGVRVNVVRAEGDWLRVESKRGNPPGYIHRNYARRLP